MQVSFVFYASVACLIFGILLCCLPVRRYWTGVNVGLFGFFIVVMGVVLMTTFKWTEVAIKISDLEVKLAEAEAAKDSAVGKLVAVQTSLTPTARSDALKSLISSYKTLASVPPSKSEVETFTKALDAASVTVVPASVVSGPKGFLDGASKQP